MKAQPGREAWHWQFGAKCALDFSSGSPVVGSSPLATGEGSASISDANSGQLLFYTEGDTVWDRNNNVMPNGTGLIGGNGTTTQAALIAQKPGSPNLYYVFTADQGGYAGPNQGVFYSIVDLNLHGGLGQVTVKNQLLTPPPTTEKLIAVKHCNDRDYWIITHSFGSNTFNAYLLSPNGVNPAPVTSNVGAMENFSNENTIGYLKASPNGKKLALTVEPPLLVELYDFDNSSGIVFHPIKIANPYCDGSNYGLTFSPDNSKLYLSNDGCNQLYQYDITGGDSVLINSSQVLVATINSDHFFEALQIGPDGKIYVAIVTTKHLAVINNPNNPGLGCNFQDSVINLTPNFSLMGLPNFIDANHAIPKHASSHTYLCSVPVDTLAVNGNGHYHWSTGDTTSTTVIHTFGIYSASYFNPEGCLEMDTFYVLQIQPPTVNILKDTAACANQLPCIINATYTNAVSYLWNDGAQFPVHGITQSGNYWVDYTEGNYCISRDSFLFAINPLPSIELGNDTALCKPYLLTAAFNQQYNWNTGASTQQITVLSSGNYYVTVTDQNNCKNSDSVNVTIYTPPLINIVKDSTECGSVFIPVSETAAYTGSISYQWNDGATSPLQTFNIPGNYWVDITLNNTCVSRDSFALNLYPYPVVDLGKDTTFCLGNLPLNAYNANCTYLWGTGQTTSLITAIHPATYWVQVNRYGCLTRDTMIVHPDLSKLQFEMPNVVTPNGDNINDEFSFAKYEFSELQLTIFNRWGNIIFESKDPDATWQPGDIAEGTYFYSGECRIDCGIGNSSRVLKGFITVIR